MTDGPELFSVVHRQRACRSFLPDDVDDEMLARVLDAATFAPSAENRQPWVFVVVRDPHVRAAIAELTRQAWRGGGREYSERRLPPALMEDVDRGAEGGIAAAPVLIVVGGDTQASHERALAASIFPAVQNLLLAATALGLGSALTTLPVGQPAIRALVGLPDHIMPMAVIPVGRPARRLGPPRREALTAKVHREDYGTPW